MAEWFRLKSMHFLIRITTKRGSTKHKAFHYQTTNQCVYRTACGNTKMFLKNPGLAGIEPATSHVSIGDAIPAVAGWWGGIKQALLMTGIM